nr:MAG TPA: hypothetical protein [Caudoviricetes sp.]
MLFLISHTLKIVSSVFFSLSDRLRVFPPCI